MKMRHSFVIAWAIVVGLVIYRHIRCPGGPQLPWPPQLIAPALGFGMLDIFGAFVSDEIASVMALGLVVAALVTKGFQPVCGPHPCATAQPASYKNLQQTPLQPPPPGQPNPVPGVTPGMGGPTV